MNFHKDILIHASVEAVFAALIQPDRVAKWSERVVRIELSEAARQLGQGVGFHQIMRYGGTEIAYPGIVEVFEPPNHLRVVICPKHYQIETNYELQSTADGTLVTVTTRLVQSRWLTKWLVIAFVKTQRRQFERDMAGFQDHFEAEIGEVSPPPRRVGPDAEFLPDEPRLDPASKI